MYEKDGEKYFVLDTHTHFWDASPENWVKGAEQYAKGWIERFHEKCIELGITNIHVHKGPTIWPLDKDAFDVSDVDRVATNYQELNFIVEHVGLPRIEDFCFMAADARQAVRRLPGVGEVSVVLEDHYTGAEINAAVGRGARFAEAFPGET